MKIAQNRDYVKWEKRQLQAMRNVFFSHPQKANSYPLGAGFAAPALVPVVNNRFSRKQPGIDGQLGIIKPAHSDRHT